MVARVAVVWCLIVRSGKRRLCARGYLRYGVRMTPEEVEATGAQIILGNTFHLWLRPGQEIVREAAWRSARFAVERAALTDSGGFRVFSPAIFVRLPSKAQFP